jgi:hypothetical protein
MEKPEEPRKIQQTEAFLPNLCHPKQEPKRTLKNKFS